MRQILRSLLISIPSTTSDCRTSCNMTKTLLFVLLGLVAVALSEHLGEDQENEIEETFDETELDNFDELQEDEDENLEESRVKRDADPKKKRKGKGKKSRKTGRKGKKIGRKNAKKGTRKNKGKAKKGGGSSLMDSFLPAASSHPPIKIIGLFFMEGRLVTPACLAFFLFTAASIRCLSSSSGIPSLRTSLRDISVLPNRQTFRLPSAVILSLLQLPQKFSDMEVMKPTWPLKPSTLNPFEVSFG